MKGHRANRPQPKGKQRIAMKVIDDEEDRPITFSKRRLGFLKKSQRISHSLRCRNWVGFFLVFWKAIFLWPPLNGCGGRPVRGRTRPEGCGPYHPPDRPGLPVSESRGSQRAPQQPGRSLEDKKVLQKVLKKKMNGLAFAPGRRRRHVKEDDED